MSCSACLRDKAVVGRGLCRACYQRWWKRGTTDLAPKRERQRCSVKDCDGWAVSHTLCDMHRIRLRDHGHLEDPRPDSWGAVEKHPLRNSWRWIKRHNGIDGRDVDPAWNDFLQFVADVGERPSDKHRLIRIDQSKPIGSANFMWREAIHVKGRNESKLEFARRYQRNYRRAQWRNVKNAELKKSYGLTVESYEEMFRAQNGKCAICSKKETLAIRGKKLSLCVDHCHKGGGVRGLLCSQCNQGLGCFKDDPNILRRAAAYVAA